MERGSQRRCCSHPLSWGSPAEPTQSLTSQETGPAPPHLRCSQSTPESTREPGQGPRSREPQPSAKCLQSCCLGTSPWGWDIPEGRGNPVPAEVTVTRQQGGASGLPAVRLSLSWPHAVLCSQAPAPQLPGGHRASRDQCTQCPPVSGISHSGPAAGGEPRACTMNPARPPWA